VFITLSLSAQETISFVQDTQEVHDINSIQGESFETVTDTNYGLNNGVFWFRISQIDNPREMLTIPSNHIANLELYDSNGKPIYTMANTRYPSFFLIDRLHEFPIYLRADFEQEAYFPIQVMEESEYIASEKYNLLGTGIFYGAIISLIFATLVFFFITKNRVFLFHALLAVVVAYTIIAKDNLFYLANIKFDYFVHLELFSHFLVGFFGFCFAYFYLKLNNQKKIFTYLLITFLSLASVAMLIYFVTEDMFYYFISDLFTLLTIINVWILGVLKTKKKVINWFIGIVYALNIYLMLEVFLLHTSGNGILGLTTTAAKFCVLFDVVLITFAMMYTFKKMQIKGLLMKQQIKTYLQRIETLDQYKKVQDADDSYLETLINEFGLANLEVKVLQGISKGHTNDHIASDYNMSKEAVKFATKSLYNKLGIEADQEIRMLVS
jgi:DNA-binding CsgD family transcriptional regulator